MIYLWYEVLLQVIHSTKFNERMRLKFSNASYSSLMVVYNLKIVTTFIMFLFCNFLWNGRRLFQFHLLLLFLYLISVWFVFSSEKWGVGEFTCLNNSSLLASLWKLHKSNTTSNHMFCTIVVVIIIIISCRLYVFGPVSKLSEM